MKKNLFFLLVLLLNFGFAQKNFKTLPKISPEDFAQQKSTITPDAPAEYLHRSMRHVILTDGTIETTYISRMIIYDKDKADSYLSPEFSIYETDDREREQILSFNAVTYNLEGGKVVTNKVEKDSKFRSKEDKNYTVTKFTFPNVKNGSIVEYKYSIGAPSRFLWSIDRFMIETSLPQRYVDYFLDSPKYLGYNINYKGEVMPKARQVEQMIIYGSEYQVYRFGYENVPAYKDEMYVLNDNNQKTSIKAELNSTHINNEYKSYATSWEDIRKRLNDYDDFGGQIKKMNLVKELLPQDVTKIATKLDRANAILKYVQSNYTWNKEVSVATEKGVKNLISSKSGNSAEINLLLLMLMRSTGLDANPVVLSTIDRGELLGYVPSIAQLNYVFVGVELDKNFYYFDATSKNARVYELPRRALNKTGVLLTDSGAKVVDVFYPKKSSTYLTVDAKLLPDGTFSGKFSDRDTNLYANLVNELYNDGKEDHIKLYKDKYKFALSDINCKLREDGDFETTLNFNSDTFVDAIGNKLAFNPLLFLYAKNHDFNQTDVRRAPIDFFTANEKVKKVEIVLPEGYVFENVPKAKKFRTDDDSIQYSYVPTLDGNKLTLETKVTIGDSTFPKEYYPAFKQIFDNITKLEGQVVTAVKK